jgi:hypothetical protein
MHKLCGAGACRVFIGANRIGYYGWKHIYLQMIENTDYENNQFFQVRNYTVIQEDTV